MATRHDRVVDGGEVPVLVHPLDRLGAGTAAIGLARPDHSPDDRSTRQPDQAVAPIRLALVSILIAKSRCVDAAAEFGGRLGKRVVEEGEIMEPGPCDGRPCLLIRELALDPDPPVQADLDRDGPDPRRVGHGDILHEIGLIIVGHDQQLVSMALGKSRQTEPALGIGAGLEALDADEIGAGEAEAPDPDVFHHRLGLLIADDALDDPARRGREGEIRSINRLGPRAPAIGESLEPGTARPAASRPRSVRVGDRGPLDRERDDLLGTQALDAEPALGIGLRLA